LFSPSSASGPIFVSPWCVPPLRPLFSLVPPLNLLLVFVDCPTQCQRGKNSFFLSLPRRRFPLLTLILQIPFSTTLLAFSYFYSPRGPQVWLPHYLRALPLGLVPRRFVKSLFISHLQALTAGEVTLLFPDEIDLFLTKSFF